MTPSQRRYRSDSNGTAAPTGTNARNHARARTKMRSKLRKKGYSEEAIEDIIEQMKFQQDVARLGLEAARQQRYDKAQAPEKKLYKIPKHDSILHGPGRATGDTAKSVKKGQAMNRDQTQYREDK